MLVQIEQLEVRGEGLEGGVIAIFALIGLALFALWIWALVDAIKVPDDSMYQAGSKIIWVIVILVAGFIGAIIYFVVGRPSKAATTTPPPSA